MSEDSIAKGLKARANARAAGQARGGGGIGPGAGVQGPLPSNYAAGGVMSQYNEWNFGISYGNGLERPWTDFLSGAFGPLAPIQPMGIDAPQTESGRPEPRRMQYPVAWNMPMGQPGSEGLKLVSFANLRAYADMYSVVRACIQVRKEEILGLDWDIVPTDVAARNMRNDSDAHEDFQDRRQEALKFFKRPDPNYHDFSGWMSAVLEDVFVVDALSLYIHPPRLDGKGLFGSNLAALEVLDGTTIRPLLDIRGGTPRPPSPAYQQYLWGVPRTDMMDIILEADIEEMDEPIEQYRADQLLYLPYTRRSWTPYGFPGIERAIIPVMTGLRRQQFQLEYFSEGSIPGQFIVPGDDISTPQQIRQLQDTLNAIAGDQSWKHKMIVLPRGSSSQPQKQIDIAGQIDETLIHAVCMAYDVMPMELGMSSGSSSSQSSGAASQMAKASQEISQRKALKPMLQWLKNAIFDHILQDICGQDDMQFMWIGIEDSVDEEVMANNFKTLIGTGVMSIDEARTQMGMSPWGLPLTSDPVYMSATGVSTLGVIPPSVADASLGDPMISPEQASSQPTTPQQVQLPSQLPQGQDQTPTVVQPAPASAAGTPGIGGRPKGGGGGAPAVTQPVNGTSTPLHSNSGKTKEQKALEVASFSELDSMRRVLKKGKSIDSWEPKFISNEVLEAVRKSYATTKNAFTAISLGKKLVKNEQRIQQRSNVIGSISLSVSAGLKQLASNIDHPKVGMIGFIDNGARILQHGYHATYNAAARQAAESYSKVSPVTPHDFKALAEARAEKQRGYLTGLAQDIKGGISEAQVNSRLNLYTRSLVPAYEEGFGLAVLSGQASGDSTSDESAAPIYDGTEGDNVDDYAALDSLYSDEGDIADGSGGGAGIGALMALADMVGGALLLASAIGADQTDEFGAQAEEDTGASDTAPRQAIIWHTNSDNPCELCAERDGETYTIDTLPCWPGDGGFGEFCDGAANCNCTLEYSDDEDSVTADNPFSDMSNDFYSQRSAEEIASDEAAQATRDADIASVAQDSPSAAAGMAARDAEFGTFYTRTGPDGNYDISAAATPLVMKAETSALENVVYHYLKQHYKKKVLKWVKDADWTFNPKISVNDLIITRSPSDISDKHVAEIKQDISAGRTIAPIVVVSTSQGYKIADGNHRVTALKQLGESTVAAYIASNVGDNGPWDALMQDDSMKKFTNIEIAKSFDSNAMYRSLEHGVISTLQVGDILTDDEVNIFTSIRPTNGEYAIVKYLPSGRLLPGEELLVVSISDNEVILEAL